MGSGGTASRDALSGLVQAGQAAWPALAVPADIFERYAGERGMIGGAAAATPATAADLFLACACAHRVRGAVEHFMQRFDREVRIAAARVDASTAFYDEVKQTLAETLFLPAAKPRIGQYTGRGPLAAWVAMAARRIAGRLRRGVRTADTLDEEAIALEAMGIEGDPEMLYLKQRYGDEVRAALVASFAALDPQDRAMLRLALVEKLSMEEVGRIFGVSQSTVSRQAERMRRAVTVSTKRRLREKLGASPAEVESIIRMVQSQVDVSFSRILA